MQRAITVSIVAIFFATILFVGVRPIFGIFVINSHTTVDQRNTVGANSGANTTDNGSVKTGNAESRGIIDTTVNTTVITCCETPKPTQKPTNNPTIAPSSTPTGKQPEPTPTGISGGGGVSGNSQGNNGANIGGAQVSVHTPEGDILGLATTSSGNPISVSAAGFGLICIGIGMLFINRRARI